MVRTLKMDILLMKSYLQIGPCRTLELHAASFNKTVVIKFEMSPESMEVKAPFSVSGFSVSGSLLVLASAGNKSVVTLNVQVVKRMFKI